MNEVPAPASKRLSNLLMRGRTVTHIFRKSYDTSTGAIQKLKSLRITYTWYLHSEIYSLSLPLTVYANGISDSKCHDSRTYSGNPEIQIFWVFVLYLFNLITDVFYAGKIVIFFYFMFILIFFLFSKKWPIDGTKNRNILI